MDCARVAREEILEGYLVGRLTDEDREAFEEHYFECTRCFDELKTLQAIREELPRVGVESETTTTRPLLRWAPAAAIAASVVLVVTVALWMRPTSPSGSPLKASEFAERGRPRRRKPARKSRTEPARASRKALAD